MTKIFPVVTSVCASTIVAFAVIPKASALDEVEARKEFIHEILVKCYVAKRMSPEAIQEYRAILKYKPMDARIHFDYANQLLASGNNKAALAEFRKSALLQPSVPEYHGAVGTLCMAQRMYEAAVAEFTKAVSLGGRFQKQLQVAQQYAAQQKQVEEYNRQLKLQQKNDDDD